MERRKSSRKVIRNKSRSPKKAPANWATSIKRQSSRRTSRNWLVQRGSQ